LNVARNSTKDLGAPRVLGVPIYDIALVSGLAETAIRVREVSSERHEREGPRDTEKMRGLSERQRKREGPARDTQRERERERHRTYARLRWQNLHLRWRKRGYRDIYPEAHRLVPKGYATA
jgi:hypothetical protein